MNGDDRGLLFNQSQHLSSYSVSGTLERWNVSSNFQVGPFNWMCNQTDDSFLYPLCLGWQYSLKQTPYQDGRQETKDGGMSISSTKQWSHAYNNSLLVSNLDQNEPLDLSKKSHLTPDTVKIETQNDVAAPVFPSKRPIKCGFCSKMVRNDNFAVHVRKHTGEKPLKCPLCCFRSANPSSMPKHMKLHEDGKRVYKCSLCSFATLYKSTMAIHLKSHQEYRKRGISPFKAAKRKS